jgi:hypothetical protein
MIVLALLLLLSAVAQAVSEVLEFRQNGRAAYVRDPWNPVEVAIILFALALFAMLLSSAIELSDVWGGGKNTLDACQKYEAAIEDGCDALGATEELRLSPCRTQLLFGLWSIIHKVSLVVGAMVILTGTHWIKYLELFPRLALPVLTVTSTFLDLGSLLIVVALLTIFFAIAFMLFIGQISARTPSPPPPPPAPTPTPSTPFTPAPRRLARGQWLPPPTRRPTSPRLATRCSRCGCSPSATSSIWTCCGARGRGASTSARGRPTRWCSMWCTTGWSWSS